MKRPYKAEAAGSTPAAPTAKALVIAELVALEAANSISRLSKKVRTKRWRSRRVSAKGPGSRSLPMARKGISRPPGRRSPHRNG